MCTNLASMGVLIGPKTLPPTEGRIAPDVVDRVDVEVDEGDDEPGHVPRARLHILTLIEQTYDVIGERSDFI